MAVAPDIVFRGRKAPTRGPVGHGPLLSVRDLAERFDECVADANVSATIGRDEVVGSLAPNGAGKTTRVRMPGTLISPTSDSATVVGISLTAADGAASRRLVAIRPESPGCTSVSARRLRRAPNGSPEQGKAAGPTAPAPTSPAPRRHEVRR